MYINVYLYGDKLISREGLTEMDIPFQRSVRRTIKMIPKLLLVIKSKVPVLNLLLYLRIAPKAHYFSLCV